MDIGDTVYGGGGKSDVSGRVVICWVCTLPGRGDFLGVACYNYGPHCLIVLPGGRAQST